MSAGDRWRGRLAIPLRGIAGATTGAMRIPAGSGLDLPVVLAVHVRHDRLEAREPGERQHLPQPVDLDDGFDAIEPRGLAAGDRWRGRMIYACSSLCNNRDNRDARSETP